MNTISRIGIDLSKNNFQVCAINSAGQTIINRNFKDFKLIEYLQKLNPVEIGIEACGSAHFWSRKFKHMGHQVKIIPPQHVKPFVKTNKSDGADALAITEAMQRPGLFFVPEKSIEQQDIQALHRVRERLVKSRTALMNETRGLLLEYGIKFKTGVSSFKKEIPRVLEEVNYDLTSRMRLLLRSLMDELYQLENQIEKIEIELREYFNNSELCQKIEKVKGLGLITTTAVVSAVGSAKQFKNGRQMAAWLGLVPRHSGTGGVVRMGSLSKRGNTYLRTLLTHGARAAVWSSQKKTDAQSLWIQEKIKRNGKNKTISAVANKNARVIWKLLTSEEQFKTFDQLTRMVS